MSECDHEWIIDGRDGDCYCSRCGVNIVDAPAEPAPTEPETEAL